MDKPYNALFSPGPAWGRLTDERLSRVLAYHDTLRVPHAPVAQPRVHAAMHVLVENQLLSGEPPFVRVHLERLLAGGVNRHEALHAIAQVAADLVMAAGLGRRYDAAAHEGALALLDPRALRGDGGGDEA